MRKKIAICASQVPFVRGGAELLVEELYKQLTLRNYDVEIIGIPFKWYPREQIINSILSWRFIDLSESNGEKIDLVIPTKFPSYVVNHHNKVTWLVHQFRQIYDQFGTEYSDFTEGPFDRNIRNQIINIDNKSLNESKKIFTIANNTTHRLKKFNGIEADTLYHPPKHVGNYFCENYDDYILSVGRLESIKRVDLLIKALKYCDKKIKVVIAGKGPYESELKKLTEKLGLNDRVSFLGFVNDDDLLKLYANAFAIFFAPFDEDYGYITLESFLSQKPVVTTNDSGGVLEFVEDEVTGLISTDEEFQISQNIEKLWNNKSLAKDLGNNGFDRIRNITWDHVVDKLTETLR